MPPFELSAQAVIDLETIADFIASDSPAAAREVVAAIRESCRLASQFPEMGFRRPRLTSKPVRFHVVPQFPNYLIAYLPDSKPLQVVRVLRAFQSTRRLVVDSAE